MILNATDFKVDEDSLGPPLDENDEKYLPEREKKFLEDLNKKSEDDETSKNDEQAQRLVHIFGVEDSQHSTGTNNETDAPQNTTDSKGVLNRNVKKVKYPTKDQDLDFTDDSSSTDVKVDKNDDAMDSRCVCVNCINNFIAAFLY